MTILVAIKCTDGVVIAADSAVAIGGTYQPTISDKQCKITIIGDALIVAGSGHVGLGQRFEAIVEDHWHSAKSNYADLIAVHMATAIAVDTITNFRSTFAPEGQYGALLAFPASDGVNVCSFVEADFQPQLLTDRMWYASMGAGQLLGDPYLRYMRHVFWKNGPPTLQGGRFAAMWVMAHAIEAAASDIALPIAMAVLQMKSTGPVARMLTEEELNEHDQAVVESTSHFREFEQRISGGSPSVKPPPIPKAPA